MTPVLPNTEMDFCTRNREQTVWKKTDVNFDFSDPCFISKSISDLHCVFAKTKDLSPISVAL